MPGKKRALKSDNEKDNGQSNDRDIDFRDRARAKLLAATEALIAAEGLSAVQARRIATKAGCAVGTVYNIYGDIDGVILAANLHTLADLTIVLKAAQANVAGADLEDRLMGLALAYLNFATGQQRRWRAIFEHQLPETVPVPQTYYDDRQALLALIAAEIALAAAEPADDCTNEPSAGPRQPYATDYEDAARALFSATHGIVLLSLDAKLGPFEPARCERQIRFLVHHVVVGLKAQSSHPGPQT